MKQVEVAICLFDEKYFNVVYFAGIMSKTFGFNEKTNKSEVGRISIWYCLLRICRNSKTWKIFRFVDVLWKQSTDILNKYFVRTFRKVFQQFLKFRIEAPKFPIHISESIRILITTDFKMNNIKYHKLNMDHCFHYKRQEYTFLVSMFTVFSLVVAASVS